MSVLSEVVRTFEVISDAKVTSEEYFDQAGVKWMGSNFKTQFLGLTIQVLQKNNLAIRKLEVNSKDGPIFKELGKKAKISISEFHAFLSANRESKEWFIFYMEGNDGNLWAVGAYWRFADVDGVGDVGWRAHAGPVALPGPWFAGHQVVSQV